MWVRGSVVDPDTDPDLLNPYPDTDPDLLNPYPDTDPDLAF